MNKVVNINLGGVPFTVDDEAFERLRRYLDVIYNHFRHTEGYEEITADIEARLAELFQEGLGNRPIVELKDVEEAIRIMGTPEDFGADEADPSASEGSAYRTGKKLYRNPEDEIIGGVCAGIAAYFGIGDPIWIRLLFVVLTLSGTFGIPIYLVLWAIIPRAKTAADKLAMRGEPINVSSIGRVVQKEFDQLSKEVTDFANDLGKGEEQGITAGSRLQQAVREVFVFLGLAIRKVFSLLGMIWKPVLLLLGGLLILILASVWVSTIIGLFTAPPYLQMLLSNSVWAGVILPLNLLMILGVPIAFAILGISRMLFHTRTSPAVRAGLGGWWVLNFISLFFLLSLSARQFSQLEAFNEELQLHPATDTLLLSAQDLIPENELFEIDREVFFEADRVTYRGVSVGINLSPDDNWRLVSRYQARGKDQASALANARAIDWVPEQSADGMRFPNALLVQEGEKFRGQKIDAELFVPMGKYIRMSPAFASMVDDAHLAGNHRDFRRKAGAEKLWRMTRDGLICENCTDQPAQNQLIGSLSTREYRDFDQVEISGPVRIRIEKQGEYEVQLLDQASQRVSLQKQGNRLLVQARPGEGTSPRIFIGVPGLEELALDRTGDVRVAGLEGPAFSLHSTGAQDIELELDVQTLELEHRGDSELEVAGQIGELVARLDDRARLEADKAHIGEVNIRMEGGSQAALPAGARVRKKSIDPDSRLLGKN